MQTNMARLEQDYDYCEQIIRTHSKSFYYAFLQLPKEKARAVFAIYAFCRWADDSVDQLGSQKEQLLALERLEKQLTQFANQEEIDHPLWRALRDVFNRFDMNIKYMYDQLQGQRMDVFFTQPETVEDLEEYSYYVAGSVGMLLLPIIASQSVVDLTETAIQLGVAMQITNILRDIGEDFTEQRRIYLPKQEMQAVGFSETDLANGIIDSGFILLWEKLAGRAEQLYDAFHSRAHHFDEDSRMPVMLSAQVYRAILDTIRNHQYNCLQQRNFVTSEQMNRIRSSLHVG